VPASVKVVQDFGREVGRCTLTPPDPQLKGAWFQTLTLEHQSSFQNVPIKLNLRRYSQDYVLYERSGALPALPARS
jgi:hypothetical protein